MFKRALLITIGLTAIGGTALACNEYSKPKVQKILIHSGDSINHNKTCTVVEIGKGDKRICPPKATPTPTSTPTPTRSPKATPTPIVTPSPAPSVTPAASQTVKSAAPAVLPSVGGSGRLKP
jgi:hypothetical protein